VTITDAEVAIAAAQAGAEVVRRDYGAAHVRHMKSATDFATKTDVDAEKAIRAILDEHRPHDGVLGEEQGLSGSEAATRRWLVDPLCGTLNFAAGTPIVAVNVALTGRGRVTAAAAADPIADEVFWTDGDRAFRRYEDEDAPLEPAAHSMLVDVNCDGPLDRPFVGGQLVADPRLRAMHGPRVVSSTLAVAWVAAGRRAAYVSDGQFRDNLHFAAGIALCEAAGCVVSDLAGDALHTGRGLLVSADEVTHRAMLDLVRPHLETVLATEPPPLSASR
jgi:myo-inositol-1(or 4)-monophosphatase